MITIVPQTQLTEWSCVHACLSAVTSVPQVTPLKRFPDKRGMSWEEMARVLVQGKLFPVKTTDQHHPLRRQGYYIVATPSLNVLGKLHAVVIHACSDGYTVIDPNAWREGYDYYGNGDVLSGRMTLAEVTYLDEEILKDDD